MNAALAMIEAAAPKDEIEPGSPRRAGEWSGSYKTPVGNFRSDCEQLESASPSGTPNSVRRREQRHRKKLAALQGYRQ